MLSYNKNFCFSKGYDEPVTPPLHLSKSHLFYVDMSIYLALISFPRELFSFSMI